MSYEGAAAVLTEASEREESKGQRRQPPLSLTTATVQFSQSTQDHPHQTLHPPKLRLQPSAKPPLAPFPEMQSHQPPAPHPSQYPPIHLSPHLRIAFIHPDLGLGASSFPLLPSLVPLPHLRSDLADPRFSLSRSAGGAERLVVDAAVELQKRGHDVEVFTSYHEDGEDGRSFEETRDGTSLSSL